MNIKKILVSSFITAIFAFNSVFAQGIYLKNFDKSVRPQDDFFKFVNGTWLKNTEIPAVESNWGAFSEIEENNKAILKQIIEEAIKRKDKEKKGSHYQLIADMYLSAMDTKTINGIGAKPLEAELANINAIKNVEDIQKTIARHQKIGASTLFGVFVSADSKNSKQNAIYLSTSGTSLPDRSYYLEENPKFAQIRTAYQAHIAKMFVLLGEPTEKATQIAQKIFKIEYRLAESQRTRVDMRNPQKNYNKRTLDELNQMLFNLDMKKHFELIGAKDVKEVLISQPEMLAMIDRMMRDVSIEDWKGYFRWKLVTSMAGYLSEEFEKENFAFFSTTLNGVKEMKPREKRMVQLLDGVLGQPLGELYVAKAFPPAAKAKMMEMITNIKEALADRINALTWMSAETKTQALIKLKSIGVKIGYPDKWRDFSSVDIKNNDYVGNLMRLREFNYNFMLSKIGQPVDKTDWGMTPPTVNAYYSPINNEIAFPAGILQPPFFDFKADDAVNYGGIGAVIGHEITHGFDDQGSQYDAEGNLKMWWTKDDRSQFDNLAGRVIEQYSSYKVLDSISVNGKLTIGENIADLGGVTLSFEALKKQWTKNKKPKKQDGFTPEQRFFIGFAQVWKRKYRTESMMQRIKTDVHSPSEFRTNGTLSNFAPFFEAFDVKEGDKMRLSKDKITVIW
ncbi:MAG: M13 family peptidase [Bacteroidetes bacterium]|nr:MAG: M13 family peptidase [Bacteroidota bacterium]TAG93813.1 MAG: M13 family peptidase [Bacteroidota bacterium]